ncbi:MAG: thermonuclease family protein [Pyrinomonadaceae bacterium]
MKNIKAFSIIFIVLIFALSAFSQRRLSGKVLEVIDGKTAIVEVASTGGKLSIVLQYVEIPEPEQPLHATVKDHLEKLILGKSVLLTAKGVVNTRTVTQLFVGGVDVSQQMIRDGAAWYSPTGAADKSNTHNEIYLSNEAQAKADKLGVWGVGGLKPAWEFRAAKAEREHAEEMAKFEEIKKRNEFQYVSKKKLPPPPAVFSNFEMWKSGRTAGMWDDIQLYMADQQYNEKGLFIYKVPSYNISFIITKDAPVNLTNGDSRPKVVCGIAYVTGKQKDGKEEKEFFGMGCRAESDKQSFKESNQLTFTSDGKKLSFGKAIHLGIQTDKRFNEMMVYFLDRNAVTRIASANKVEIKIGSYSGAMSANFHSMIKNLVTESANEIK